MNSTVTSQNSGEGGGEDAAKKSTKFLNKSLVILNAAAAGPIVGLVDPLYLALTIVGISTGVVVVLPWLLDQRAR